MRSSMIRLGRTLMLAAFIMLSTGSLLEAQGRRGYLGIMLEECTDCQRIEAEGGVVIWRFATPPRVQSVYEQSPAAKAGLREGDILVAVQGVDITTEEGGRLFGAMRVGVPVELRVRRASGITNVILTPGTMVEAFGEERAAVAFAPQWDSVRVQFKVMYEGLPKLQIALKQAEEALARTEAEAERTSSAAQLRQAELQRAQIDSMQRQLEQWYRVIRVYTDSLAARTLYVKPRRGAEVDVRVVPPPEAGTITIYSDAAAGARFKALTEESPLAEYFGVTSGLLITELVENAPAHTAGLREGDVVISIAGQPVKSVKELRKLLRGTVEVAYVRKGKKLTCTIPSKKE